MISLLDRFRRNYNLPWLVINVIIIFSADERLLAELVARLDKPPTVGIVLCQSFNVDKSNNILPSRENWTADLDEQTWKKYFVNNGKDECSRYLIRKNTIPNTSAVLIKTNNIPKSGRR